MKRGTKMPNRHEIWLIAVCTLLFFWASSKAQTNLQIPWSSLNGGGAIFLPDSSRELSYSVGQPIIGSSQIDSVEMQIGFWSRFACAAIPGDAISFGQISLADVISIVNYIFNKPCPNTNESGFECWRSEERRVGKECRSRWSQYH